MLNRFMVISIMGILIIGFFFTFLESDQFADAGSRKKIHFTQTVTSSQDPGQENESRQLAFILSPNKGTLYDGSITYTSSEPVQILILHEIDSRDINGQPTWTIDGKTVYGLSLIDVPKHSDSFEFTGSAVALYSTNSKEFTATVSADGWIRGQPSEILIQKIELDTKEPVSLLSRTNIPVIIPMHKGIYEGDQIFYIITDSDDKNYAKSLSEKQGWNVEVASALSNIPKDTLHKLFIFKNGIKGDGIYGFQDEVFSNTPSQESDYSSLTSVVEVTWKMGQKEIVLESVDDIITAKESGRIEFDETQIILNTPQIVWPGGQMTVRADKEISDDALFFGGQIIEINKDELTVTFVSHRSWGPDGKTIYYILTNATPHGPAKSMGVISSPTLANSIIDTSIADFFHFNNGIKGSGPLGFQPGISNVSIGDSNYTPIWRIHMVEWNNPESAKILETMSDIDAFNSSDLLSVSAAKPTNNNYIVNAPLIDPFQ